MSDPFQRGFECAFEIPQRFSLLHSKAGQMEEERIGLCQSNKRPFCGLDLFHVGFVNQVVLVSN